MPVHPAATILLMPLLAALQAPPPPAEPVSGGGTPPAAPTEPASPAPSSDEPSAAPDEPTEPTSSADSLDEDAAIEEAIIDDASLEPQATKRVYLIVDRLTELGGPVVRETADEITILHAGREKTFPKNRLISLVTMVDPVPGQNGVLRMRDGTTFRGIVISDDLDGVVMEIAGIRTPFSRDKVLGVVLEDSDAAKYARMKAHIPEQDHVRRLALCRWLFDRRMYRECLAEVDALLEDFNIGEARRLRTTVAAQLALEEEVEPIEFGEEGGRPIRSGTIPLKDLLPDRLLSTEDVNLIRVYEIDFRRPPRIAISPETIRTLIEEHAAHPSIPSTSEGRTRLFREDPVELVRLMFELKARDLYPQIDVESEPYALNLFRQRVHDAWLIGNCATSRCHGGLDGGRFFLHQRNSRDERVRFTNLLILLRLRLGPQPLVNFDRPLESLIIQHGLPRTEARFPHPDVPGWKPVFTNANQRLLADSLRWIESMYQPRPEYPVEYEPPILDLPPKRDVEGGEPDAGPTR